MKTDWSNYSITYDGITYDLQYRDKVNLIACEDYTPNSPSPDYPSPIVSIGDPSGIDFAVTGYAAQTYSAHRDVILRSLPDGTHDTYDAVTGTVTRNVGVKVFDGTETWIYTSNRFVCQIPDVVKYDFGVFYDAISTHYVCVKATLPQLTEFSINSNGYIAVYSNGVQTVAGFKAWLAAQYAAGHPVTVEYELATPTTEHIDPIPLPTYPRYTTLNCSEQMTAKVRVVDIC